MPGAPDQQPPPALSKEQFQRWKACRDLEREQKAQEAAAQRRADIEAGRVQMTGKELYEHHPELFEDY
ncbi:hypothetical protein WJX72_000366 [[Myrmecia] bisecta]|uniref:ZC3H15/TMA46 family C-terminal domain-containing protein n=1 Tax=[Myrmecia] bisecta TaxID=41462 RepID=A0AAW1PWR6_9CHLO